MRRPQVSTAIEGQSEYKEDQAKDEFEEEEAEEEEQVITGQDIFIDYEKIIIILLSFLNSNDAESTSKDLIMNRMKFIVRYNLLQLNGYKIFSILLLQGF